MNCFSRLFKKNSKNAKNSNKESDGYRFFSPVKGLAKNITDSKDPAYAQKLVGDGIMIFPTDNKVYAPVDGRIEFIFPYRHAFGIRTCTNLDLFLHIGVGTEKLKGNGFQMFVTEGQDVKQGQLIAEFDLMKLKKRAISPALSVLITNLPNTQRLLSYTDKNVTLEDIIFEIR